MTFVRTHALHHGVAILLVGVAAALSFLLWPLVIAHQQALVPVFLIAVAISAWCWGWGPGLTAALGSFLALLILLKAFGQLPSVDRFEVLWAGTLFAMAILIGMQRAARKHAEHALAERTWRLQLVSDQIPGGLWSTDAELRITSGFGAQSHLLHGDVDSSLEAHFGDTPVGRETVAAHRRALRGQACAYEVEWAGRTFQCRVQPLRADGEILGVVGAATDITDRKAAEKDRERLLAEVERAKHQLENAGRAKDRFLATLSHELRTPLTPVLALASALRGRHDLPTDVTEDLETIRRNAELERTLIDDLLDLTRVAAGKLQLHREAVDAHELLGNTLDVVREDLKHKGVAVVMDLSADRQYVFGDAARLQQVFWNLIKNAVKFTPSGGTVRVRTAVVGPDLRIEIIDSGIGIAAGALAKIFEPFEQGAEQITRQFGGLGLGLHICKALVDAHGGRITAASDGPGTGAAFAVEVALTDAPAATSSTGHTPAVDVPGLRILLVEDHADTAKVMQRLLAGAGHTVAVACTVQAALRQLAETGGADLLISDIGLPDGSGLDLMRQVAQTYGLKGIALSGYGTEADVAECASAGFAAHLTKPVPLSALRRAIAAVAG
ncbi:MAG TPA: ATP-binding protein [Tepidisphaeraceae bacterium]|nr:ATP-binding protein [Tepidisphaeraceae bacterium]